MSIWENSLKYSPLPYFSVMGGRENTEEAQVFTILVARTEDTYKIYCVSPDNLVILHCKSTPMTDYSVGWVGLRHISKAFTALDSWLLRTSQPL